MLKLTVNGTSRSLEVDPATPLLWVLRDHLGLTGTKYGCGVGLCGICTVHLDGEAVRACLIPAGSVGDRAVTTIEGLSADGSHPVQRAFLAAAAPQCGFCQCGQVMAAAALFQAASPPSPATVERAMSQVLCRCGSYGRIRNALDRLYRQEEA